MPVEFDIDEENHAVLVTASGKTTGEELVNLLGALAADPRYVPDMVVLCDSRNSDIVSGDEVRQAASILSDFKDVVSTRGAIVVSSEVAYGLGRMLALYTEPDGLVVRVFRDVYAARDWLGLPTDDLPEEGAR